jgi:hypothetical protein
LLKKITTCKRFGMNTIVQNPRRTDKHMQPTN